MNQNSSLHLSLAAGVSGGSQLLVFLIVGRRSCLVGAAVRPQMSRPNKACCFVNKNQIKEMNPNRSQAESWVLKSLSWRL